MRRHIAALKVLRHSTTTAEERLDLLRAVVAPSAAMVEEIEERDARGDLSWT